MNDHTSRHRILTPALLAFTLAAGLCTAPAASAAGFELERELDHPGVRAVLVGATDQDKAFLYLGDANGFPTFPSKALFVEGGAPGYGYVVAKSWHLDLKQALSHHVRGTIAALRRRLTPRTGYQHALWGEVHASGVGSAGQRGRDPWEFRGLCFQMVTGRTGGAARARCEGGSETLA